MKRKTDNTWDQIIPKSAVTVHPESPKSISLDKHDQSMAEKEVHNSLFHQTRKFLDEPCPCCKNEFQHTKTQHRAKTTLFSETSPLLPKYPFMDRTPATNHSETKHDHTTQSYFDRQQTSTLNITNSVYFPFQKSPISKPDNSKPKQLPENNIPRLWKPSSMLDRNIEGKAIIIPASRPSHEEQALRSWLRAYLSSNPELRKRIQWYSPSAQQNNQQKSKKNHWTPEPYSGSGLLAGQDPYLLSHVAKELLSLMWTIEKRYQYYGVIQTSYQPNVLNLHSQSYPPQLNLPESISTGGPKRQIIEHYARSYFLAYLAHAFVLEKNSILAWKLTDYQPSQIQCLLDSTYFYYLPHGEISTGLIPSPSDPTEIFLWMWQQQNPNWIVSSRGTSLFDNKARTQARDAIFRWWRDHLRHTSGNRWLTERTSENRVPCQNLDCYEKSIDCFLEAYFGTDRLPPLRDILGGNSIEEAEYRYAVYNPQQKKYEFFYLAPVPQAIKIANQSKRSYNYRFDGCPSAARAFYYLLHLVNIPSYFNNEIKISNNPIFDPKSNSSVEPFYYHYSLILPAEPNPQSSESWVILHTDDVTSQFYTLGNPLYEPKLSDIAWTWKQFRSAMSLPEGSSNLPKSYPVCQSTSNLRYRTKPAQSNTFPNQPPSRVTGERTKNQLLQQLQYESRFDEIQLYNKLCLLLQYPPLPVIVSALMRKGMLAKYTPLTLETPSFEKKPPSFKKSSSFKKEVYYKGPMSGFLYTEQTALFGGYLGSNDTLESIVTYLASPSGAGSKQLIALLDLVKQKESLSSRAEQAKFYFTEFDKKVLSSFSP